MGTFLQIIPYPIYPPRNGGALRCIHLLKQLSKHRHGRAIVYQDPAELTALQKELGHETIIQSSASGPWSKSRVAAGHWAGLRYRWLTRSLRGPAEGFFLDAYSTIREPDHLTSAPDVVLFEGVGTLSLAPVLRRLTPKSTFILDAHNVDHVLMKQEMDAVLKQGSHPGKSKRRAFQMIERRERNLSQYVDAFFACSEEDRVTLASINKSVSGFVVPNGVDCSAISFLPVHDRKPNYNVLFCGSLDYRPNIDGLNWFGSLVWPTVIERLPEATLTIVGRCGDRKQFGEWVLGPEIRWIGEVYDVLEHYHCSAVAICPLRMGSGTRLKILEAMSSGTPLVSTTLGAQGLLDKCLPALDIVDSAENFASAVCRVLRDRAYADKKSHSGRQLALSNFDWDVVGSKMEEFILGLRDSSVSNTS